MMAEQEPTFLEVVSTDARELRTAYAGMQAGVMDAGDLKVTAGAGLSIAVAAGTAFVQGTNITDQGLYRVRNDAPKNSAAFTLGAIPANASGQPRIDQVIARVMDQSHDGSGLRLWRLEYVAGVGTAAATIDNRNGAISDAALGNNWLRLADVRVNNGASAPTEIRDRRKWARGAFSLITRASADYTTGSITSVEIDTTNLKPRIECSGVPLRVKLQGRITHSTAPVFIGFEVWMDGVRVPGQRQTLTRIEAIGLAMAEPEWTFVPPAGSHLFSLAWSTNTATATLAANGTHAAAMVVEELVRQNASNT